MTEFENHYRALEALYLSAPINAHFPTDIKIGDGSAEISMTIGEDHYHAANAAHGTVYFKALDDACFFAVASKVTDMFVLTTNFNLNLTRPVQAGPLTARGRWVHGERRVFLAEAILLDAEGEPIARGSGTFMRSRKPLDSLAGYKLAKS
ncbi:MAG: PaaI family thioesterase [Sphingomonadales bacterium]|jgi:uncharacterized protein (TIGR00369 family)